MNFWVCREAPGFDVGLQVRHQNFLSLSDVSFSGKMLSLFFFCKAFPSLGSHL
jgi:hypothetical protein